MTTRRMPAEWERHDATWLGWPSNEADWPGKLDAVRWAMAEFVRAVAQGERVELLCADESARDDARSRLQRAHAPLERITLRIVPMDRTWLRDTAPAFVRTPRAVQLVRWRFNGWAKYDNWKLDARIPDSVSAWTELPLTQAARPDDGEPLVMEGGAIDVDGRGSLLTTEECLLDPQTQTRNPGLSREGYEQAFRDMLGAERTIWLGASCAGDDTHGHVDDVARFTPDGRVLLAVEPDPGDDNHAPSADNLDRLRAAQVPAVELPFPNPVFFDGERLPASYANFYCCNAATLVPTFNDPADRVALEIIQRAFPDRPALGIHALDLVWGFGTLHCLSQQQPAAG